MNEYTQQALDKVKEDPKVTNRCCSIIRSKTVEVLEGFIKRYDEFAQAVVQGESMHDMFDTICKEIEKKQGLSDIEVYQRAVDFFFPGAKIYCHMDLDLCGSVREHKTERTSLDLSFDDLFG